MKVVSWNVNGIRAVERKGALEEFLGKESPDILFLQETKAKPEQLSPALTETDDWEKHYYSAEKAGYSGTAVWVKKGTFPSYQVERGIPDFPDDEGRLIRVETDKAMLLGGYFPNGGKSEEAWQGKLAYYDHFLKFINAEREKGKKIIFTGDLNVAHNEIDLARPKENKDSIGFLPEERSWVDRVIESGWVDTFRHLHPETVSYTWWSMQTRARERNIGWRIDYFFADSSLMKSVKRIEHLNDQMGSDHCPIVLEISKI